MNGAPVPEHVCRRVNGGAGLQCGCAPEFCARRSQCSVCGADEVALIDGTGKAWCLEHVPEQWRPLFVVPVWTDE